MSTLSKKEILERLGSREIEKKLVVTPLLDPSKQIGNGAIDLRLGNQFILVKRTSSTSIDLGNIKQLEEQIGEYQNMVRLNFGQEFVLHPQELVLGSTMEYLGIPLNCLGYVLGRSSWGRLGLIVATATVVNPGFKGCLTLELVNVGTVPLKIYPGARIAQLVLHTMEGETDFSSRYDCPTGPEFSKIYMDKDLNFWSEFK